MDNVVFCFCVIIFGYAMLTGQLARLGAIIMGLLVLYIFS